MRSARYVTVFMISLCFFDVRTSVMRLLSRAVIRDDSPCC